MSMTGCLTSELSLLVSSFDSKNGEITTFKDKHRCYTQSYPIRDYNPKDLLVGMFLKPTCYWYTTVQGYANNRFGEPKVVFDPTCSNKVAASSNWIKKKG